MKKDLFGSFFIGCGKDFFLLPIGPFGLLFDHRMPYEPTVFVSRMIAVPARASTGFRAIEGEGKSAGPLSQFRIRLPEYVRHRTDDAHIDCL
jgi:hypothetical protein